MKRPLKRPPPRLAAQYRYIGEHFCEPLVISTMAKKADCTVAHFIAMFRRFYGTSPKNYMTGLRLGRAKLLLSLTELPVCRIAALCGYDDEFYFYRLFRRRFGVTPLTYRKRIRKAAREEDIECLL